MTPVKLRGDTAGRPRDVYSWSVAVGLCTVYILVLLMLCYSLPFSQLFRKLHSYDDLFQQVEKATERRSHEAKHYFENLIPKESSTFYTHRLRRNNLTFMLGIITVQRRKESKGQHSYGYLLQSASLLDTILKRYSYFNNSVPFICNVDVFPQKHLDAVGLYQLMPYIERYGLNSLGITPIMIPGSNLSFGLEAHHASRYHKESFDYAFCLLSAAALRPEYIILIEDDTLVHRDFPAVLEDFIQSRLKLTYEHSHNNKFAFLKLYFPAKWQGFGFELSKLLDLLSWSVVGGSLLYLASLLCSVRQRPVSYSSTRHFLAWCCLAMISCWLIGRQNLNELRRISKHFYRMQSSEGCCTQAMLYPVDVVDALSDYLVSSSSSQHTDLAILDFVEGSGLPTYQVEPSLFWHVGLHTTLNLAQKHPEEFIVAV